jgi:hypothetical protein
MKFINFFLFVRVSFALLISDPNRESGSGSRDPIESGSNPDPQHWLKGWFLSRIQIFSIKKKKIQKFALNVQDLDFFEKITDPT